MRTNSLKLQSFILGSAVVSLFIAPSITPWRYVIVSETEPPHNPGARLIKYDRQSGRQLDILQYYVDLPAANANRQLNWTLGYIATNEFSIPDITPESMDALVIKLQDSSGQIFKKYVNWYNTNAIKGYPCNTQCHKSVMCGLRHMKEEDFVRCLTAVSKSCICFNQFQVFLTFFVMSAIYYTCR